MNENLKKTIEKIEKEFGSGSIMFLSDKPQNIDHIPTGIAVLDDILGIGGVPKGRIIEIYGTESGGKTTLTQHIIKEAQAKKILCAFIDAEHAFDPKYAKNIGVDIESLLISQPDTGEQALEITEELVRSGVVGLVVVDSVAALVPKAEIDGEMGDSHMGLQARLMSQALRKLTGIVSKTNTVVIFINQIRSKIGIMFGSPETTTGGNALKYYSSIRLDVRRKETLKKDNEEYGIRTKVKVVKNKVAPPFKTCEFDIIFGKGISLTGSLFDFAVDKKIISKSGSWFAFNGENIGQGRDKCIEAVENNKKLSDKIKEKLNGKQNQKDSKHLNALIVDI